MGTWIVDLDGTLALRRQGEGERGPFDWSRVGEDLPNLPVIRLVHGLWMAGDDFIHLSGRLDVCRLQTEMWLRTHVWNPLFPELQLWAEGDDSPPLFMRDEARPYMPDDQLKREIYDQEIVGKYEITGVIDDRDRVVQMWRSIGLTCIQVADGNF